MSLCDLKDKRLRNQTPQPFFCCPFISSEDFTMTAFTLQHSFAQVDSNIVATSLLRQQKNLLEKSNKLNSTTTSIPRVVSNHQYDTDTTYVPLSLLKSITHYSKLRKETGFKSKITDKRCRVTGVKMSKCFSTKKYPSENIYISVKWIEKLFHEKPYLFTVEKLSERLYDFIVEKI